MALGVGQLIRDGLQKQSAARNQLLSKLADLKTQIQEAETQLREINAALNVYMDMSAKIPAEEWIREDIAALVPGSVAHKAVIALRKLGRPSDTASIVLAAGDVPNSENKRSYQSQISSYGRKGKIFTQDARGIYGLKEWNFSAGAIVSADPNDADIEAAITEVNEGPPDYDDFDLGDLGPPPEFEEPDDIEYPAPYDDFDVGDLGPPLDVDARGTSDD